MLLPGPVQYCSQHSCIIVVELLLQPFSQRPSSASIKRSLLEEKPFPAYHLPYQELMEPKRKYDYVIIQWVIGSFQWHIRKRRLFSGQESHLFDFYSSFTFPVTQVASSTCYFKVVTHLTTKQTRLCLTSVLSLFVSSVNALSKVRFYLFLQDQNKYQIMNI